MKLAYLAGGQTWDKDISLPYDEHAVGRISKKLAPILLETPSLIAVHTGTSHPQKRWETARYIELCRRILTESKRGVLLVGGPEEKSAAQSIRQEVPGVHDWTGETTLSELAALFRHPRISALISSDSGPVHVAWIAQTPVVAFYAMDLKGSDPVRWGPKDDVSEAIHKPLKEIEVSQVMSALHRVLLRPSDKVRA